MAKPVTHISPRINAMSLIDLHDLPSEERKCQLSNIIESFKQHVEERSNHHLGYPYNLNYDYTELAELVTKYSLNNLGDPFIESNYGVHTRGFEIAVLDWFASMWELSKEEYWGYVTACGTEGNLSAMYIARENFPDGVLYTSEETHYSIFKSARMYRMDCNCIPTQHNGELRYDLLEKQLKKTKQLSGRPAIINVNIGTTVKGAVDDVDTVLRCLESAGYAEDEYFIHCDGALFGMMMPFLDQDQQRQISFKKNIGSISVSGHKSIGSPQPCGVLVTRLEYIHALSTNIEYINSRDVTIMGSRNGQAPIYLWYALAVKGLDGLKTDVQHCMKTAKMLYDMLIQNAGMSKDDIILNDLSCTVVFPKPRDPEVIKKWQLACKGDICHIVVMPNVSVDKLKQFVDDYAAC